MSVDKLDTVAKCAAVLNQLRACGLFGDTQDKRIQLGENSKNILDMYVSSILMKMFELSFAEEKAPKETRYNVYLLNHGDKHIQCVRAIREVTTLGLKEAKQLSDLAAHEYPQLIDIPFKENLSFNEAKMIAEKFTDIGATVEVREANADTI